MIYNRRIHTLVLAAGQGKRMGNRLPKILHPLAGQPLIHYLLNTLKTLEYNKIGIVTSPQLKQHFASFQPHVYVQEKANGTAGAVQSADRFLQQAEDNADMLIACGDTPLLTKETLQKLIQRKHDKDTPDIVVLCMTPLNPSGYGRVILKNKDQVEKIVEEKDADAKEKNISLCNAGVYCVSSHALQKLLPLIKSYNAQKEFYLTDIIALAQQHNLRTCFTTCTEEESLGVNTQQDLVKIHTILQNKFRSHFLENGVIITDPQNVYFSFDTLIESGTLIEPNVHFASGVKVEKDAHIRSFSYLEECHIKAKAIIGPFARIRPGTVIEEQAQIGNFVEIKKSQIGPKVKINHLTYVGDATIGTKTNIGAGTIFCNYDGYEKHKTYVGEHVFIGSNTSLVAPLQIDSGAIIGAGSTIVKDVNCEDLVVARASQKNISKGAQKYKKSKIKE